MATEEDIYDSIDARLQRTGGPAFPLARQTPIDNEGMDLRDWFAGKALSGVMQDKSIWDCREDERLQVGVRMYAWADAMLAARKAGA